MVQFLVLKVYAQKLPKMVLVIYGNNWVTNFQSLLYLATFGAVIEY